jgi:hypothetical protein
VVNPAPEPWSDADLAAVTLLDGWLRCRCGSDQWIAVTYGYLCGRPHCLEWRGARGTRRLALPGTMLCRVAQVGRG